MRFAVESWSPDYGSPTDAAALEASERQVDPWVEHDAGRWGPLASGAAEPLGAVAFVDGVRRVEANVWITDAEGQVHQGICASYAAGVVRCDGAARVVAAAVRRGLFAPAEGAAPIATRHGHFDLHPTTADDPDTLSLRLQQAMGELEAEVSLAAVDVDVVVVDGPLRLGAHRPGFVGYVKTHRASYGPPLVRDVVTRLAPGERTPMLLIDGPVSRFSWYLRLPCAMAHGWDGVVRLEVPADRPVAETAALAERLGATLPRFASTPHKDPRAPQNLVPIGGLERELRHRLGDAPLLLRALRTAATGQVA
ncbi:DNA double-strand break repair nuclease NurA [Rhabdothermincola salaria]|uniref:DNA double-strand break repair nuclease NurA n=1 Tax=Rhabdothermincola salaria TaxID=2903142 RepID=UPI001E4DBBB1|nr:DNA double-strand break repair nuclease NurA [Rhabdothermincola salaria]MCD9623829.1 hypothetical protein [Rhabdothermincola salaria]